MVKSLHIVILVALLSLVGGCREYHQFEFKHAEAEAFGGSVILNLIGGAETQSRENGKKLSYVGGPYALRFFLTVPFELDVKEVRVRSIVMVGRTSQTRFTPEDISRTRVYDPRDGPDDRRPKGKTVILSVPKSALKDLKYEAHDVTATVVAVLADGSTLEQEISVTLETGFHKSYSNDWFDEMMSV